MTQWIRSSVNFLPIFALLLLGFQQSIAQGENAGVELSPYRAQQISNSTEVAPFDLQFSFDASAASGAGGNAGAEFDGTYYYTTRWASNLIHKYDLTGALVEQFSVPGVTGLRDLAFDGTYMYGSNATTTIYQMDFVAQTLVGTITGLPVAVRHIAYDPDADGFWIGTWDTDITLVSRAGATLDAITGHGLAGMYGSAHDSWTAGGPYLWVFDQGAGADTPQLVHQFNISTGAATGVTYDVGGDFVSAGDIAGGLFAAEGIVPGTASLGGLLQGTPNWFFVYELTTLAGIDPVIAVSPTFISETLTANDSIDVTVTVSNNGGSDLDWSAAITSSAMQGRVQVRKNPDQDVRANESGYQEMQEKAGANVGITPTVFGVSTSRYAFSPPVDGDVLYDQTGAAVIGAGYTSQDFEASQDAFDNQGADDFVVPGGETWNINQVTALGVYYNGFGPMPATNVFFYADAGGSPGTLVDSRPMVTPTSDVTGTVVLDFADVSLGSGTYWISVQARMDFAAGGQWGWTPNNAATGAPAHWQNPGNGFATGCVTWNTASACIAQAEPDYAFILAGTIGGGGGGLEWISLIGTTSGTITPGNSSTFDVRLRGVASPTEGDTTYTGTIEITSNDPAMPSVIIDVTLMVVTSTPEPQMSLTHTPGNLNMGIFNDGSIGAEQVGFIGPGITWNGVNGCFVGGPIFGTTAVGAVNGLIGSFTIYGDLVNVSSNFAGGFTSDADFDQIASADLDDSGAAAPYGVDILQRSYSNTGEEAGFIRYGYVNNSGNDLADFYSGIFVDWDVDNYLTNSGGYDVDRNMIYQFDAVGADPYFGLIALDGISGGRATTDTPPGSVQAGSFEYITTFDFTIPANGDFRSWIGSGPFNMDPGATVWASYAVVAGSDLGELQANADAAIAKATAVGWIGTTGVGDPTAEIPAEFGLSQNYPNPFNPATRITYALPSEASVTLKVYNVLGQEVITLENSVQQAGIHEVSWNGKNSLGQSVGSGVYFYRMEAQGSSGETFANLKKMLFLK